MISLSHETETLARRIAQAQRLCVDDAIRRALEAQARVAGFPQGPRDLSPQAVAARRARTDRLVAEFAAMPVLDPRPVRELIEELNAL